MRIREDWRTSAKCADVNLNPDIWFADPAEEEDRAEAVKARVDMCTARDVCRMCPVRSECLEYAMYRPFLQGIWGGLSSGERSTLRTVRARDDYSLIEGMFPEPDITAYIEGSSANQKPDGIANALKARRICKECKEEKSYYISRNLGKCRDCAGQL